MPLSDRTLRGGSIVFEYGATEKERRSGSRRSFNGFNGTLDSSGRQRPEIPNRRPGDPKSPPEIPNRRPPVKALAPPSPVESVESSDESRDYSDQLHPMSVPMDPSLSTAEEGVPPVVLEGSLDDPEFDDVDDISERRTFNVKLPSESHVDVPEDGRCSFDDICVPEGIMKATDDGYANFDPETFKNRNEEYPVLGAEEKKSDETRFDSSKYRWAKKERGIPVLPHELGFIYRTSQRDDVMSMDTLDYGHQVFLSGMSAPSCSSVDPLDDETIDSPRTGHVKQDFLNGITGDERSERVREPPDE